MNICYLSLGSNQNTPERQIRLAVKALKKLPRTYITNISQLYWNKAWGVETQQDFCNVVIEMCTLLDPYLLLQKCQKIEDHQGRVRKKQWGPRTIDIDIILYKNRTINSPKLIIPHPFFKARDFVLKPLLEINPKLHFN
jgi:2-amino-4-hydroxy-6-hydroxymethyldihydropteridine diphosphokinase